MFFDSFDFALFLPIVYALYWLVFKNSIKQQNVLLVVASYFFYGYWDWRFLSLILFSTVVDYTIGIYLGKVEKISKRKLLLLASIIVNLGFLGFFKYYNFFVESFVDTFSLLGYKMEASSLNIVLPVGISFYTFQTLSYSIDIYRRKLEPSKDFVSFVAFVSFFPQLVAGPIERATNLLPQFSRERKFNYDQSVDALRQILWGLFKKMVIANNCAEFANTIFNNAHDYSGSTLVLGAVFFAFQIYGDFSGYSDIAIGTARLFGFNLMQNFAFPYFSRDIAEFWRRWHISLSTWFRDYLYIPLGGSKGRKINQIKNVFIIFIVSGFWHGSKWTFIVWGALNAVYFLPLMLAGKNRKNLEVVAQGKLFPSLSQLGKILLTFGLTVFAWIFFRAETMSEAIYYCSKIFSSSLIKAPMFEGFKQAIIVMGIVGCFLVVEWLGREKQYAIEGIGANWNKVIRWGFYYVIVFLIFYYSGKEQEFIYFQF